MLLETVLISYRGVAQLVAHTSGGRDAAGSSPVTPTKKQTDHIIMRSVFVLTRFLHDFI